MYGSKDRLVIFDLDGTLADTVPVIAHHIAETITSFGTLVRPEDVVPYIGRPLEVALAELAERPADDPRIAEIIDAYRARWRGAVDVHGETLLLPGARALLRRLREAGLALQRWVHEGFILENHTASWFAAYGP